MGNPVNLIGRRMVQPLPIPARACIIRGDHGVRGVVFSLAHRGRAGVEIWICVAETRDVARQWCVSRTENIDLPSFAAARVWVHAWAARYGRRIREDVPARRCPKIGPRACRALLAAGGCRESWLTSDAPRLAAEGAVRCQSPAADCHHYGRCQYGTCDMEMDVDDAS